MGWLVGLWDGAHRWSIRNHFWSVIISFLIYQKLISEFSQQYFWNTINCNFATRLATLPFIYPCMLFTLSISWPLPLLEMPLAERLKNLYRGQLFNFCFPRFFPENFTPRDAHCFWQPPGDLSWPPFNLPLTSQDHSLTSQDHSLTSQDPPLTSHDPQQSHLPFFIKILHS